MNIVGKIAGGVLSIAPKALQTRMKEEAELMYWRRELRKSGGKFYNGHFESRFTDLFGLERSYFDGKRMIDLGCGPLGSLEWATGAAERVGADPLADRYIALNGGGQTMRYVRAGSESLPFPDARFDVVSMFNALDHVEDVEASIAEMQRILAPGGDLLLIVEIDHPATVTEPHRLHESTLEAFDRCTVEESRVFAIRDDHDVYRSLRDARPRANVGDPAILCARLVKHP
ncbi:class I SAM-dependent methyltransferase [Jannaschia sp. S6380]|uniref:class I SAM-dependent methyltransferase n=1 Tax=Jannaschia sp. S6380 TaxID=2926408 RepID=UPI001FF3652D|nr:class I SAM-dependent methyltransferase [Jannaschia sp. S6380]MCK0168472.1 class I SAM-dependent methyltransferase [Jannaschia sp. S6380]